MTFRKTTEESSRYDSLETMSISALLQNINSEDKTVPLAVEKALPQIEAPVMQVVEKLRNGGRFWKSGNLKSTVQHFFPK